MKVTFKPTGKAGKIASNRKEDSFSNQYSVYTPDGIEILCARIYSTQARNYACVWLKVPAALNNKAHCGEGNEGLYLSGGGFAGGYGYHRPSAAIQSALENAGIFLSDDIGGRGEQAMIDALLEVARAAVYAPLRKKLFLGKAHA